MDFSRMSDSSDDAQRRDHFPSTTGNCETSALAHPFEPVSKVSVRPMVYDLNPLRNGAQSDRLNHHAWPEWLKPCFRHPDIVKHISKRYLLPLSQTKVTTRFWFGLLAAISKGKLPQRPGGIEPPRIPSLSQIFTRVASYRSRPISNALGHELPCRHIGEQNPSPNCPFHRPLPESTSFARAFTHS